MIFLEDICDEYDNLLESIFDDGKIEFFNYILDKDIDIKERICKYVYSIDSEKDTNEQKEMRKIIYKSYPPPVEKKVIKKESIPPTKEVQALILQRTKMLDNVFKYKF